MSLSWPSSKSVPVGLGVLFLTGTGIYLFLSRRRKTVDLDNLKWESVGKISELIIYPVKSARGVSVQSAQATRTGLQNGQLLDRSFIVFQENGTMVTGRDRPLLTTIETSVTSTSLTLCSLKGDKISIDLASLIGKKNVKLIIRGEPAEGVDCGDLVADWLSSYLYSESTRKVRLYYYKCPSSWTRGLRKLDYFKFPTIKEGDTTVYMDCSSYNIASSSSLEELNTRLETPVGMNFFRPPIVVEGSSPWDEDNWEYIRIGKKVVLRLAKPCERCELITVDPATGIKRRDHVNEMLKYRMVSYPKKLAESWPTRPVFGLHCGIETTGEIQVGDSVEIYRPKNNYWRI